MKLQNRILCFYHRPHIHTQSHGSACRLAVPMWKFYEQLFYDQYRSSSNNNNKFLNHIRLDFGLTFYDEKKNSFSETCNRVEYLNYMMRLAILAREPHWLCWRQWKRWQRRKQWLSCPSFAHKSKKAINFVVYS